MASAEGHSTPSSPPGDSWLPLLKESSSGGAGLLGEDVGFVSLLEKTDSVLQHSLHHRITGSYDRPWQALQVAGMGCVGMGASWGWWEGWCG